MARGKKKKGIYEQFHGRKPNSVQKMKWRDPKKLVFLGRACEIVYESDKLNGGGDGELAKYIHEFHPDTALFTDERGEYLIIVGKKLTVTERGIVN